MNQLLTGQHLANSGEAQLKKTPFRNHDASVGDASDAVENDNEMLMMMMMM